MMKRVILVLFVSTLSLASCNLKTEKKHLIGVSQCSDDLWRETVNKEMIREVSFYPDMAIEIKTVKDDTQQQIKDIEYFISKKVDILVVAPNESTAITPVLQKAYRSDIPLILLDRKIDTDDYTAYVGADNYQLAYELGYYVANLLNGKGNIVEIRGWKGSTADDDRHEGFTNAISDFPGLRVIEERRGDFLQNVAKRQMDSVLREGHSHIDLVFAMNDPMALGVNEALSRYSGRRPYIIGIDALPGKGGGIDLISRGVIDASFIYPTGGDKVIDIAHRIINNMPFEKENTLYTAVVDRSNARVIQLQTDQIYEQQTKFDRLTDLLDKSLIQYSNQSSMFYIALLLLLLISIFLVLVAVAYRTKSRTNAKLQRQNEEIREQARVLAEQKEKLQELSNQLEEATQAKLVFFTNISHEFKTPLSLIMGPVETILADAGITNENRELLTLVKRNTSRLLILLSQLIEFRTYENGKMDAFFTRDDLRVFLEELNSLFTEAVARKNINFTFEAQETSYSMWFDKEKLEKIYFNLLSNAFKFVNNRGDIKVSLHVEKMEDGNYAEFAVFNSGSFIPADKRANIFDRFYKLGYHDGDTGIGLALTNSLVEIHGGKIEVDSRQYEGTTFRIILPFEQPDNSKYTEGENNYHYKSGYSQQQLALMSIRTPEPDVFQEPPQSGKPLILLIEDNLDMRRFVSYILDDEYTVIESADGKEGISKAIKYVPDVIISDVMMPERDGFEICRILKSNITTNHIPIILLTAFSMDEQKAIGFESGADAYISKPFNAELLKIRIRKLIENREKIKSVFGNNWINENKKFTLAHTEQAFINKFRQYVESRIQEEELSVDEIARHLGFSRAQLYRKISSITEYSPKELVSLTKVKFAVNLMLNHQKTISEAAFEAGFSSPSYFTKVFRKYYNDSPTEYLKKKTETN